MRVDEYSVRHVECVQPNDDEACEANEEHSELVIENDGDDGV